RRTCAGRCSGSCGEETPHRAIWHCSCSTLLSGAGRKSYGPGTATPQKRPPGRRRAPPGGITGQRKGQTVTTCKWQIVASVLTAYFEGRLPTPSGGAVLVGNPGSADVTVVAYAKGEPDEAVRVADLFRCWLRATRQAEVAFTLSRSESTWAVIVQTDDSIFHTPAGRAFHAEMLRARLEEAVYAAWHATHEPEWAEGTPAAHDQPQPVW